MPTALWMQVIMTLLLAGIASLAAADEIDGATKKGTAEKGTQSKPQVIRLSASAAAAVKEILRENMSPADTFLRVKVLGNSREGFRYDMQFAQPSDKTSNDKECESHGVKVLVGLKSALYLEGTKIDYETNPKRGFRFNNPNAVEPLK